MQEISEEIEVTKVTTTSVAKVEPAVDPTDVQDAMDVAELTVSDNLEHDGSEEMSTKATEDEEKQCEAMAGDQMDIAEGDKDPMAAGEQPNWLAPSIKKVSNEAVPRNEQQQQVSTLTVMDEETRMSAESGSRSQTPARNMSAPGTCFC